MNVAHIHFFDRNSPDTGSRSAVKTWLEEQAEPEFAKRFGVILHNDPINGVDYVARVIKSVFGYSLPKSIWLMMKAHVTGKSTLWIGAQREAEQKRDQMIAHGPDPHMKKAQPLTVTVERVE